MLMFTLAICCLTTSNLPWFMDLKFQLLCNIVFYSIRLLSPPDTCTTERDFHVGPTSSFFLELLFSSSSVAYWAPTDLAGSSSYTISFCLIILFMGSQGKNTGVVCYSLLHWTRFCQNSSLWPICLTWPSTAWLIASLSYANPFTTRLWSMKVRSYAKSV